MRPYTTADFKNAFRSLLIASYTYSHKALFIPNLEAHKGMNRSVITYSLILLFIAKVSLLFAGAALNDFDGAGLSLKTKNHKQPLMSEVSFCCEEDNKSESDDNDEEFCGSVENDEFTHYSGLHFIGASKFNSHRVDSEGSLFLVYRSLRL